jgi:hypothetical protein
MSHAFSKVALAISGLISSALGELDAASKGVIENVAVTRQATVRRMLIVLIRFLQEYGIVAGGINHPSIRIYG